MADEKNSASSDDRGYILAVLLIGMAIAAVWMTASLPAWRQQAQREKELELKFRGEQYARAIALFYIKNNTLPQDIDVLVSQHFLRKKWKDPITNDDFVPVLTGQTQGVGNTTSNLGRPGGTGPGAAQPGGTQQPARGGTPQGQPQTGQGLGSGGIVGVMSKSKATSIILYSGPSANRPPAQEHDLWVFNYLDACVKMGQQPRCQPGGNNPAGRGTGPGGTGPRGTGPGGTGPRGTGPGGTGPTIGGSGGQGGNGPPILPPGGRGRGGN